MSDPTSLWLILALQTDILTLDIIDGDLLSGAASGEVKVSFGDFLQYRGSSSPCILCQRWNPSFQCTSVGRDAGRLLARLI